MVNINAVVSIAGGYGVVVDIFACGRRTLANVHKIDPQTGKLLECPDKERCNHGRTCPIHSVNVDTYELTPWPSKDVAFYVTEGMLCADIARKATAPIIRVEHRRRKFNVTACADGFVINKVTISEDTHPEEYRKAVQSLKEGQDDRLGICTAFTINNPDSEAYRAFAAVFDGTALGSV